jgi:hypothetical protein
MQKLGLLGLVTLAIVGCRTHHVPDCRPACDDADRTIFAQCVASGNPMPFCEAGNRMCCATMVAHCVGELDDQTVVSDAPTCPSGMTIDAPMCEAPCTPDDETSYEACLSDGSAECPSPGDEECCALAEGCLGDLGDVTVTHVGCCSTADDCTAAGTFCDPMFWTCMGAPAGCGDGVTTSPEECDDHNTITEECVYGQRACTVCDASCHSVPGVTHHCDDGTIDLSDGETCEPPNEPLICDASCHSLQPASCTNGILDGTESDIDCGGSECAACLSGGICFAPSDCRAIHDDCAGRADCPVTGSGVCLETTRCEDGDACTDDQCDAAGGCLHPPLDHDGDGHMPNAGGCGDDCNDRRSNVFLGADELCDGVDNDCDESIDETCT